MYKIKQNITWCGKTYLEGMFYDFHEATRPQQIKALIDKGLIEPIQEDLLKDKPAPVDEQPVKINSSKTVNRSKGKK